MSTLSNSCNSLSRKYTHEPSCMYHHSNLKSSYHLESSCPLYPAVPDHVSDEAGSEASAGIVYRVVLGLYLGYIRVTISAPTGR